MEFHKFEFGNVLGTTLRNIRRNPEYKKVRTCGKINTRGYCLTLCNTIVTLLKFTAPNVDRTIYYILDPYNIW